MARDTPTEESLGLGATADELASNSVQDDDIGLSDDIVEPEQPAAEPARPQAEAKPGEESRTVDIRALQEARSEAREARQHAAVLEQRWNDFLAGQNRAPETKQEAPAIPRFNNDPISAGEWTQQQIIAMQEAQATERQQSAERQQQEQAFNQTFQRVEADYNAAATADPTLNQAYSRLRESQGNELLAMGYSIPEAKEELARIERGHIEFVASRGLNIGDYIKSLASARGWQASAAAPAIAPPVKTDLASVASAQQRHQSLSDAPGGEAVAPLDAKALGRMTDKQFKAWMETKGNAAKLDEIMGA